MKPLPAIAFLLIGIAGMIALVRTGAEGENAPSPTRTVSRERGAVARRPETARRIFDPGLDRSEQVSFIRSLSNEKLRRLTMNLVRSVVAHGEESETRDNIRLLTLLAMESGRRDFDGFLTEIDDLIAPLPNQDEGLRLKLACAAVAGLAEDQPQRAVEILSGLPFTWDSVEHALATEATFRSWIELAPNDALASVESGKVSGIENAIRGMLSANVDSSRRDAILEIANSLLSRNKEAGEHVSRNSIDAILNDPYRFNVASFKASVALGLAQRDPDAGWEWLRNQTFESGETPVIEDVPILRGLFDSESSKFLRGLGKQDPASATAFLMRHEDQLHRLEKANLASGLLSHDPTAALEIVAKAADPSDRLDSFETMIRKLPGLGLVSAWPILDEDRGSLRRPEILGSLFGAIDLLNLPDDLQNKARSIIREVENH